MTNMLVIRSSAMGAKSVTNKLIDQYLSDYRTAHPDATIVERNLDTDPVAHIHANTLAGIGRPAPETEAAIPTRALSDALIAELSAADALVIGAPMYNFGMPTVLKSWFDHVLRAGATFNYTPNGPDGLMTGKHALIVTARGGIYSEGPSAAKDFVVPHLLTLLGFIGITDVNVVYAEGMALGPDSAAKGIASAEHELKQFVAA